MAQRPGIRLPVSGQGKAGQTILQGVTALLSLTCKTESPVQPFNSQHLEYILAQYTPSESRDGISFNC